MPVASFCHLLRQSDASSPQRRESGRAVGLRRRTGTRVGLPLLPVAPAALSVVLELRRRSRRRPRQLCGVRLAAAAAAAAITIEDTPASSYVTANHVGRGY